MTWEQKVMALKSLGEVTLGIRKPGDWWLSVSRVERKEGSILSGGWSSGSPEQATDQYWEWATDSRYYLVIRAGLPDRKAVKWNGFMWDTVTEATSGRS